MLADRATRLLCWSKGTPSEKQTLRWRSVRYWGEWWASRGEDAGLHLRLTFGDTAPLFIGACSRSGDEPTQLFVEHLEGSAACVCVWAADSERMVAGNSLNTYLI